jgi:hypothetical protein
MPSGNFLSGGFMIYFVPIQKQFVTARFFRAKPFRNVKTQRQPKSNQQMSVGSQIVPSGFRSSVAPDGSVMTTEMSLQMLTGAED